MLYSDLERNRGDVWVVGKRTAQPGVRRGVPEMELVHERRGRLTGQSFPQKQPRWGDATRKLGEEAVVHK